MSNWMCQLGRERQDFMRSLSLLALQRLQFARFCSCLASMGALACGMDYQRHPLAPQVSYSHFFYWRVFPF
jgi:hypothetical protein